MDISKLKIENTTYDIKDSVARSSISDLQNSISTVVDNTAGHDYVEIGGIKWATMNIGANSITDTGLYFQWGDTQGYTADQVGSGEGQKYFGWEDYKYGNGTSSPGTAGMTKYNATDGKTVLDLSDDAARINWGGSWRMPTTEEYVALGNAVNSVWTADYQGSGVAGVVLTDKNDSSKELFFPFAGFCEAGSARSVDSGIYCSSTLETIVPQYCYSFMAGEYGIIYSDKSNSRNRGLSVRGVFDGPTTTTVSNYVEKSSTEGLLKNDGTVDTNTYLTQHQDISGKANVLHTHTTSDVTDLIEHVDNTNGYQYVDLGLPSGKMWASMNVGASDELDYGTAFQWGATSAYNGTDNYYNGAMSENDILPATSDTARQMMSGGWRIPTIEEWKELIDNTYTTTFQMNNSAGNTVYGISFYKKDYTASIKIPLHYYVEEQGQFMEGDFYALELYPTSQVGVNGNPYVVNIRQSGNNGEALLWGSSLSKRTHLYNIRAIIDGGAVDRDKYIPSSAKGANNGVVPLGANGKIEDRYIPSKYRDRIQTGYYYNGNFYSQTPYHGIGAPTPKSEQIISPEQNKVYFDWETYSLFVYNGSNYAKVKSNGGPIKSNATDTEWIQTPDPYYAYIITVTKDLNASSLLASYDWNDGQEVRVIFKASSQHTVTINHNATYAACPDGANLTLTIPAGGFREVTFMKAGGVTYVIPNKVS